MFNKRNQLTRKNTKILITLRWITIIHGIAIYEMHRTFIAVRMNCKKAIFWNVCAIHVQIFALGTFRLCLDMKTNLFISNLPIFFFNCLMLDLEEISIILRWCNQDNIQWTVVFNKLSVPGSKNLKSHTNHINTSKII